MTTSVARQGKTALPEIDGFVTTATVLAIVLAVIVLKGALPDFATFPRDWAIPFSRFANYLSDLVSVQVQPVTRAFAALLGVPMSWLRSSLIWIPWPVTVVALLILSYRAAGIGLATFSVTVAAYLLATGYWTATMNTMALVLLAVPIAVSMGFGVGVLAFSFPRLRGAIELALDLMQTVPAFAYLIPLLILFGFGPVVGLIASVVFAIPPMVRNTLVGLNQIPASIVEAGLMAGCTHWQQFWKVEVPTAKPQLLVGINQSTMAAFSMVIIGSLAGGSDDIGWEVLAAVRQADFGGSLLSGMVIAVVAMLIDRITLGFAKGSSVRHQTSRRDNCLFIAAAAALCVAAIVIRQVFGDAGWLAGDTGYINTSGVDIALLNLTRDHAELIESVKNSIISFFMLPIRIGLQKAVSTFTWGMELTPGFIATYLSLFFAAALISYKKWGWKPAATIVWIGLFLYFGVTTFPWLGFLITVTFLCWRVANGKLAIFAAAVMIFALTSGLWSATLQSVYLCGIAVITCVIFGGLLGCWAANNARVSRSIRPICDTLQTMPQFVFLIPALMFFKVGDLTALIAVILYSIVPPIRYVEHGLRHVPVNVVEAAEQAGCTLGQMFFYVELPLALPSIMLGLNQTIMAALSMLAVAALVGTRDLGQQVYIALGKADAGMGLIAGLMIALIAIISDRVIRCWCRNRQGAKSEGTW